MRRLVQRRWALTLVLVAVSATAVRWQQQAGVTHPHLVYLTGWGLFGLMLFLTAYNVRKKLPFLPLLSSRTWLQAHLYIGLFTALVFLLHLSWRVPTGRFEAVLAALFVGVTVSGIVGWWLSRALPPRLTTLGGEVPYERIPLIRRALREQAETLVLTCIPSAKAAVLADFYATELSAFFAGPANLGAHLVGSQRPLNAHLAALELARRFFNTEEQKATVELAALIRQKDALDFHRAVQLLLKGWLFVHIPLTYGLLMFSAVHVVLVYAFSGGAR